MEDVRTKTGLTKDQFQKLNEKMLETTAQKNAERAFRDIANAAGLSQKELEELGKQSGFTSDQLKKMGVSADEATKKIEPQTSLASRLTAGWAAFAAGAVAVYGAFKALKSFVDAASEAEEVENRLAFALENVGYKWDETKGYVDAFARSVQESTRFTDEDARRSLTTMTLYTDDLTKATRASSLAMDLSVRSGMGLQEATEAVGMAMAGNVRGLGRYIPELRNLEHGLGANMTATEKAEYALGLLEKRVGGSAAADINSYAGSVKNAEKAFDDLKETLGKFLIPTLTESFRWLKAIVDKLNEMVDPSLQTKYDEAVKAWTKIRTNIAAVEKEIREGGMFPGVLQQQLNTLNKQLAEQQAIIDRLAPALKKANEEISNFKPITDAPLFDKNAIKDAEDIEKVISKIRDDVGKKRIKAAEEEQKAEDAIGKATVEAAWEDAQAQIKIVEDGLRQEAKLKADALRDQDKSSEAFILANYDRLDKMYKDKQALEGDDFKKQTANELSLWKLSKSISDDIAKMNKNDYQVRLDLVEDEYQKRMEAAQGDADLIVSLAEWKRLKQREILEEQAIEYGSFWDGMKVQYDRNLRDQITWGEEGAKIWQGIFGPGGALQGTLNTFFDDLFAGELKTAEDYFKSFTDAILKMFAKMIAEMIAQWAAVKFGELIGLGGGTGTSITGGGVNLGSITNSANTGSSIISGANTVYGAISGGIPLFGSGGALSTWLSGAGATGLESSLAAFGGTSTSAGLGSGAAAGGGIAAGAAAGAGIGLAVAAYITLMKKYAAGTGLGINPFYTYGGGVPGTWWLVNPGALPGFGEYDMSQVPSAQSLADKFREQFGVNPPTAQNLPNAQVNALAQWAMMQPEMIQAAKDYQLWLDRNYEYVTPAGDEGMTAYWRKIDRDHHARSPYTDQITYAAEGGIIDEPMIAIGRHSRRRMVIGEAGREFIIPEREIARILRDQQSLGLMEPWPTIGYPMAHKSGWASLVKDYPEKYEEQERNRINLERTTKETLMMPWLKEAVKSGRYGNPNWKDPSTMAGSGEGMPININLNLDGKTIGDVLLNISKLGVKVVHQRGITAN